MLPFYKKTLLVLQDTPIITQATIIYQDLNNIIDKVIKKKGNYKHINKEIRQAVLVGRKVLDDYTRKIDSKTLILYTTTILNPCVKTEFLKVYL